MTHFKPNPAVQQDVLWLSTLILPDQTPSFRLGAALTSRYLGIRVMRYAEIAELDRIFEVHRPKVIAITKPRSEHALRLFERARKEGVRLVSAFADWSFDGDVGRLTRTFARASDAVVVQTRPMAAALEEQTGVRPTIIEECLEYPRLPPRFAPQDPVKLLWYGTENNHDTLEAFAQALGAYKSRPLELRVLSEKTPPFLRKGRNPFPYAITFYSWQPSMQFAMMRECDLVALPSANAPEKRVKGHNRLTEAINIGRLPLAYPLPQYEELADYAYVDDDLVAGIDWALRRPADVLRRLAAGQAYLDRRFALPVVSRKWHDLFLGLLEKPERS